VLLEVFDRIDETAQGFGDRAALAGHIDLEALRHIEARGIVHCARTTDVNTDHCVVITMNNLVLIRSISSPGTSLTRSSRDLGTWSRRV
jgi:hypothetical protein